MPQIRPLADTVHYKVFNLLTYMLTYTITVTATATIVVFVIVIIIYTSTVTADHCRVLLLINH